MKYCKRCINSDTRPNIQFDEDGVCPVCRHFDQRRQGAIDWQARRKELEEIGRWGRENSKCGYDCIVAVSGGKDSTRQAFYVRDELKLKPLLVSSVYPPEQLVDRGAYNMSNMVAHGFDHISISLNPQVWKKMMRQAFFKYSNWCKSTELALYAIPIHTAIAYKIPLVFLGENPAYTIGESHGSTDGDASRMKYCNTLAGGRPDHLVTEDIDAKEMYFYTYPPDDDMEYAKIRIAYLGYFIEDFTAFKNAEFAIAHGLKIRKELPEEIGDITRSQSLDEDFYMVNQMMKYVKLGFGQVTDKVCEAINLGIMDRETGIDLAKKYDGKCHHRYVEKFCKYLEISEDEFWEVVESCRDHNIWERDENGHWKLKLEMK